MHFGLFVLKALPSVWWFSVTLYLWEGGSKSYPGLPGRLFVGGLWVKGCDAGWFIHVFGSFFWGSQDAEELKVFSLVRRSFQRRQLMFCEQVEEGPGSPSSSWTCTCNSVNMMNYNDMFSDVKPTWSWWIFFSVLLKWICWCLVKDFCVCAHGGYLSLSSLSWNVFDDFGTRVTVALANELRSIPFSCAF